METSKEASEENPAAKSSGSIIQISSIYIELPLAPPEMDGSGCSNHNFSMRGFTFAKRGSNQNVSSLFPSIGDSNDKELPPMDVPTYRYWRCSECRSKEIEDSGLVIAGVQQGPTAEINEGIRSIGTNAGIQQVLRPKPTEGIQSIGTNLGIQHGLAAETSEDIRSIANSSGIQQSPLAQPADSIRSIGTSVGKLKGPTAQTTEGIRSIGTNVNANANTVECSMFVPNTQKTATAKAVEITYTGDKNEPMEHKKDAVEKISDEGKNTKAGQVITGGDTEVPAGKINTDSGDFSTRCELHKSENRNKPVIPPEKDKCTSVEHTSVEHTANGIPGKIDETESDRCRENDNSNGMPRRKIRKVRLLTDLLGEKDNSRVNTTERNSCISSALLESAGSGNAALEGQVGPGKDVANGVQSPRRKTKVNREDEETNDPSNAASNVKATKKDTGKAIMVTDVHNSDVDVVPSSGEGLFIGTKAERLRRRSDVTPSLSRKKNKPTEVLDFSASLPSLVGSLPASSAAGSWGGHPSMEQTGRNHVGLLSGAFKCQSSYNRSAKVGLDLSLGNFPKGNHYQDSGSKAFLKKDDIIFGQSNARLAAELDRYCSKGQPLDLNERAALISYNLEKNKYPVQREMDFLQLGLKEKSCDQANLKESDQRADDIPMDIVELLAKKQYERRYSNRGDNPMVQRTGGTTRRFFDGEVMETMKHLTRGYPALPSFSSVDAQRDATVLNENARTHKGNLVLFSQMSKNHLKLVQPEENQKSIFTSSSQNQQKPSSGIQISHPASVRAGHPYTDALESLLSSTSSKLAFGFGIQQKQAAQQHQGRTISDIKPDELRKTEEARLTFIRPGGSVIGSKTKGPLDTYSNESIPALQLLSLMDGRSSGTACGFGTTKILDKPFLPCSYHPRFSRDERQDFLNGSMFLPQSHPKEPSSLRPTLLTSYQSLRPHSAALSSHISFITPEKEMSRDRPQNSGSSSGGGPSSSHEKVHPNTMLNGSDIIVLPQKYQRPTDSRRTILEAITLPGGVRPGRNISTDGVCRTNRNPAEFSIPEAGNMYTICGRDLKSRKRKPYTRRTPSVKVDDNKRQRIKKGKPVNEHPKDNSS